MKENPMAKYGFQCGACDTIHDKRSDAQKCCPLQIHKGWFCENCEDIYDNQEDAMKCENEDRGDEMRSKREADRIDARIEACIGK